MNRAGLRACIRDSPGDRHLGHGNGSAVVGVAPAGHFLAVGVAIAVSVGIGGIGAVLVLAQAPETVKVVVPSRLPERGGLRCRERRSVDADVVQQTREPAVLRQSPVPHEETGARVVFQRSGVSGGPDRFAVDGEPQVGAVKGRDYVVGPTGHDEVVGRLDAGGLAACGTGDLEDQGVEFRLVDGVSVAAAGVLLGRDDHRAVLGPVGDRVAVERIETGVEGDGKQRRLVVGAVGHVDRVVLPVEVPGGAERPGNDRGAIDGPVVAVDAAVRGDNAGSLVKRPVSQRFRQGRAGGIESVVDFPSVTHAVVVGVGVMRIGAVLVFLEIGKAVCVGVVGRIGRIGRIKGVLDLPPVSHAVLVGVQVRERDVDAGRIVGQGQRIQRVRAQRLAHVVGAVAVGVSPGLDPIVGESRHRGDGIGTGIGDALRVRCVPPVGSGRSHDVDRAGESPVVAHASRDFHREGRRIVKVGTRLDFLAVFGAVVVGIGIVRVGAGDVFAEVAQRIAVGVPFGRLVDVAEVRNLPPVRKAVCIRIRIGKRDIGARRIVRQVQGIGGIRSLRFPEVVGAVAVGIAPGLDPVVRKGGHVRYGVDARPRDRDGVGRLPPVRRRGRYDVDDAGQAAAVGDSP